MHRLARVSEGNANCTIVNGRRVALSGGTRSRYVLDWEARRAYADGDMTEAYAWFSASGSVVAWCSDVADLESSIVAARSGLTSRVEDSAPYSLYHRTRSDIVAALPHSCTS